MNTTASTFFKFAFVQELFSKESEITLSPKFILLNLLSIKRQESGCKSCTYLQIFS